MTRNESVQAGSGFKILVANVCGWMDIGVIVAAIRAEATGVLNAENARDRAEIERALARISRLTTKPFGIKLDSSFPHAGDVLRDLPAQVELVIFNCSDAPKLAQIVAGARAQSREVLLEVTSSEQVRLGEELAVDGLIAKGHEAGGRVGEETTFILLQRLLCESRLPVWAHGGIGLHTAAACRAAGAAGVVLDSQLLLTPEATLPLKVRAAVERLEGDETLCLGQELGDQYRVYRRPGVVSVAALQLLERQLVAGSEPSQSRDRWREALLRGVDWTRVDDTVWPLGQDAAFAPGLARRFGNVAGIVRGLRESVANHLELAAQHDPLKEGSPLAQDHGTRFPVLQGPMTRVSDTAAFAEAVAAGGGLPFLALALMRPAQIRPLLMETTRRLGDRPWGVGILGFVPPELRAEQLEAVREVHPPFAIIAGGRPDQAASLEREGIRTYLHIPAPTLLQLFLQDGARRFIFEGRECGGHVGPRTSFVLWESMIDTLLGAIEQGVKAEELHVVFAGGIHDGRSGAMIAAMAAPLAARGVRIGALMGTAYLFTREAVASGAIVEGFQEEALRCQRTVLLETGPGHATRCAETPFYDAFLRAKRELRELSTEKNGGENIREALEQLNLGRLRVASKGITRSGSGQNVEYVCIAPEQQRTEGMYMIGQVAALRSSICSIQELHEGVCAGFSTHVRNPGGQAERLDAVSGPRPQPPCDVAIIGTGCVLPKSPNVAAFWANLLDKVDVLTEVPRERFDINLYYDRDRQARDKIYSRWGGFLDDVPFDPLRYGIPPAALSSIDPMQLLALVVVDQALRDAGYTEKDFTRERTSAIFGASGGLGDLGGKYAVRSWLKQCLADVPEELLERLPEWTEDSFPGLLPNVVAGRVANRFNLGGVNFTVDAACASSLAAAYLGVNELTAGTSDMVIVGGVDTVQNPFCFLCFAKSQALSPRGKCRPFDRSADGIAISEGVTVLILKRLADAERDGDRIYAVIKGIAGSSDGRGRSMTAPRPEGQKLVLRRAYEQAGLSPATVGLVEAHGTGTVAGDTAELASLSDIMRESGATQGSCAIGSVKSMLGHTKSAAGITGLMKVALALHHKVLTPTLHVESPNAKLRENGSPIFVNTMPQPWIPPSGVPRRAGVSSFGFGGTNFHAVLEEYQGELRDPADLPTRDEWPAELFVWNASSAEALAPLLAMFARRLESGASPSLRELAAATCRRADAVRDAGVRLAIVATSLDDLKAKVSQAQTAIPTGQKIPNSQGIYIGQGGTRPKVAFLFPGQGSQRPRMLSELALHFPEFRASMESAETVLAGRLPRPLSRYIYPPPPFTAEEEREQMSALTDTVIAQPALGVIEAGLATLLNRLGVAPDMTAGHSYGEYVALWAAGVFSQEALINLSEVRGRSIKESVPGDTGTMAAVQGDRQAVSEALREIAGVIIANENSPQQLVIAGPSAAVETAAKNLNVRGLPTKTLPVACAFHSELMQPARARLASELTRQSFSQPTLAVFSNTLGARYPQEPENIATILTDHLVQPVRFTDEIRAMYEDGARVFVEVGPKAVLTGLARQTLTGTDAVCIETDGGDRNGLAHLLQVLGQLLAAGVPVEAMQLFRGRVKGVSEVEKLLDAQPAPPPAWLVNGGHVFAGSKRPPVYEPLKFAVKPMQASANGAPSAPAQRLVSGSESGAAPASAVSHVAASAEHAVAPVPSSHVTPMPIPPTYGTLEAVMLPFQQLMSQFLQTQAAIMTAYLQNAPVEGIPAPPVPVVMQPLMAPDPVLTPPPGIVTGPVELRPQEPAAKTEPAKAAEAPTTRPPQPVTAPQRSISADLVRIVSDRTGYPVEMLSLDASIEADLGIDSIKRVEILSSFQRLCSQSEQAALQGIMEKLTSATTLREIAERIASVLEPVSASGTRVDTPAAQPAPAIPSSAPRDIAGELIKIVSERTGYPAEMLDLNAGIESDLGIDSIKRVEILSSFQRLCSAAEQAALQGIMEKLTSATTLGQIAEDVAAALTLSPPAQSTAQKSSPLPRYVPVAVERPRRGKQQHYPGRLCLITDDETGIAARVAEDLARAGERPVLLRHSPDATLGANGVQSTDLRDPVAIQTLIEALRVKYGRVGAIIHLLPLRTEHSSPVKDLADWSDRVRIDVTSLYALIRVAEKDLQQAGRNGGALLAAVTARGGDFGLGSGASVAPTHQAIADFLKTAALEVSEARTKIVDLDASDPIAVLHQKIMDELTSDDDALQVGLPGDHRLVPVIQSSSLADQPRRRIASDCVCLVTGGARGITASIAQSLAQNRRPTLILVGTTPYPEKEESADTASIIDPVRLKAALVAKMRASGASVKPADVESAAQKLVREREIRATVQSLRQQGCRVAYHAVDVRDEVAFSSLIDSLYAEYGRLDVVIHGAGIIEDKLIRDKTPESFERVLHTKADSMFILSRKLRSESLQCLLLMSSVTAAFGNRGQADYGAANGILNGFALELASRWPRARVVSVNWGPWDHSGMVSEQVRRQFLERGVEPIPPSAGVEAALDEIEAGSRTQPAVVSGNGPWAKEAVSVLTARALAANGSQA